MDAFLLRIWTPAATHVATNLIVADVVPVDGGFCVTVPSRENLLGSLVKRLGFVPSLDGAFKPITC